MKEIILADTNPLANLQNQLWETFEIFRGDRSFEKYDCVFFLLVLHREGVLNHLNDAVGTSSAQKIMWALAHHRSEAAEGIRKVSGIFEPALYSMHELILSSMVGRLASLNQELLFEHFGELFEELLYKYIWFKGRTSDDEFLPVELSRFVCELAEPTTSTRIYNPFAGLASFGVFLKDGPFYLGQEINPATWALGTLRLIVHDKTRNFEFLQTDSIAHWNGWENAIKSESKGLEGESEKKFDVIISNPPFGVSLPVPIEGKFGAIRNYEHFLIERSIRDLKQDGKLIAVLSQGFLFRGGTQQLLREYLVEEDLIDLVVSLPEGLLPYTGIGVAVVVLNKSKKDKGVVRMVDARKLVELSNSRVKRLDTNALTTIIRNANESAHLKIVPNIEIKSFDYNLSVPRYFQKKYDGVLLKDFGVIVRGQRTTEFEIGKVIRTRDLSDDNWNYQLSLENVKEEIIPSMQSIQRISHSCLLLASRGNSLKPTYFSYQGTPIYISNDIIALNVNESKCDLIYLINELRAAYVTEQLESLQVGAVQPMIRRQDLMSIIIDLPTLENQREALKKVFAEFAEEKMKEIDSINKLHGLELFEQNTYLRHTLAGPTSNLKGSVASLIAILKEQVLPGNPDLLKLKVSERHTITLGKHLEIIERDVNRIVSAVRSQLKVDVGIEKKELYPVEIISFLRSFAVEYKERPGLNFTVDFQFDEKVFLNEDGQLIRTFILANSDLLRDLFGNLVENAIKHAFGKGKTHRLEIYVTKNTVDEELNEVSVLVSNTGEPFPEGFGITEFIRKGSKSGPNAGDGFGGWYINEIIKRLNGDFDIIDETGPEGLPETDLATSFEIDFPIIETEENGQI